jgi:hypothetical protein
MPATSDVICQGSCWRKWLYMRRRVMSVNLEPIAYQACPVYLGFTPPSLSPDSAAIVRWICGNAVQPAAVIWNHLLIRPPGNKTKLLDLAFHQQQATITSCLLILPHPLFRRHPRKCRLFHPTAGYLKSLIDTPLWKKTKYPLFHNHLIYWSWV